MIRHMGVAPPPVRRKYFLKPVVSVNVVNIPGLGKLEGTRDGASSSTFPKLTGQTKSCLARVLIP